MSREPATGALPGKGGRTKSFSLVELLVAMAILSILVVVLLGMSTSLMSTWQFGQARNERRTTGQAVLERMSRDLRLASLPLSRSSTNSLQFVINPAGAAGYEFPHAVFWQAPVAADGGGSGNMAVVGYFVQWVTNGTSFTPCLTRMLVNPSSPAANYAIYSNPTSWVTTSILTNTASASSTSGYAGLLANNVLGLWVQALDPHGNPIQQSGLPAGEIFDSRLPYSYTNSVYTVASTNVASVLPSAVQIAILVVDSRTAKRLKGNEIPPALAGNFWAGIQSFTTSLPAVIQKGAEIQTTTVDLANGPR